MRGGTVLGVGLDELQSRQRQPCVVHAREALAVVGVERYGLRVVDIARAIRKSPDGISKAIARANRRRLEDHGYLDTLNRVDADIAKYRDKYYKGGKA